MHASRIDAAMFLGALSELSVGSGALVSVVLQMLQICQV